MKQEVPQFKPKAEYFEKPVKKEMEKKIALKSEKIEVEIEPKPLFGHKKEHLPLLPFEDRWRPKKTHLNFKIRRSYWE